MVVVDGGRITAVGPADRTQAPPGSELLDLTNRFVMPGLIDCHSHASIVPGLGDQLGQLCRGPVPQALAATANLRTDLAAGTTTMRVMGEEQGEIWLNQVGAMITRMSRIFITPEWVGVLDFETRFPSAIEHAMERAAGAGA